MTYTQGVVLGLVQGLTEFLPVSSSGHLILVPHLFGWPDQGLAFDAVMHLGTLAALLAYFRGELLGMASGTLSARLVAILAVGTIPGAVAGLLFERVVAAELRSPLIIAVSTAAWAIVMWAADRRATAVPRAPGDPLERVSWAQGLVVGFAQAIALIPGTSRSGITITAGLLGGVDRSTAARFSFLLGIPITMAVGAHKAVHLSSTGLPPGELGPLLVALAAAFVSGWFAVWLLVSYLKTRSLRPFVVYRLLLALGILVITLRA